VLINENEIVVAKTEYLRLGSYVKSGWKIIRSHEEKEDR